MRRSKKFGRLRPRTCPWLFILGGLVSCDARPPQSLSSGNAGAGGADLSLLGGAVRISIPPGALTSVVQIDAVPTAARPSIANTVPGAVYELRPASVRFNRPVSVQLQYDPAVLPDVLVEDELRVFKISGASWTEVEGSHASAGYAVANVRELGIFGVFGVAVSSVSVTPQAVRLLTEDEVVSFSVRALDATGKDLPKRPILWSSSDSALARVLGPSREVLAHYGTSVITATSEGRSASATVEVVQGAAKPIVLEEFSSYANTDDLLSNSRRVFMLGEDQGVSGTYTLLALDKTAGNPYSANGQSMRYDFMDRTGQGGSGAAGRCSDFGVTRTVALNPEHDAGSGPGEVWAEFYLRFTPNWTATAPNAWGCTSGRDYKLIFGQVYGPQSGRFDFEVNDTDWSWSDPDGLIAQSVRFPLPSHLQDGKWHRFRTHYKVSSATNRPDGAYQVWLDNSVAYDKRDVSINRQGLWGIKLGANLNQGPARLQSLWWGRVRVLTADPGW